MAALADERQHVGEGWQPLIDRIDQGVTELAGEYTVLQIKEKFGGLRFYMDLPAELDTDTFSKAYDLVHKAEGESFSICEWCGQPGECRANLFGWMKTLCPTHWDEDDERARREKEQLDG